MRRVVVTGLGIVSPLGRNIETNWKKLIDGQNGISQVQSLVEAQLPCQIAAMVPETSEPKKYSADISRFIGFALEAADEALKQSGWTPQNDQERERCGVHVGSGMGSFGDIIETWDTMKEKGFKKVSPFFVPKILVNMASGQISIKHQLRGPTHAASTACATGAHAIGDAYLMIMNGLADRMLAGGSEASVHPLSIAGFSRAKALATSFNDNPGVASRPFDAEREGFVMAEGAGVIFLEEYSLAKARNANILAEVLGYGLTGDGFHITQSNGNGAERAMRAALKQAQLRPKDIDYLNAHATSTPLGDVVESAAIQRVFGESHSELLVSSTKGATGHLQGAAGAVETIYTILALCHNIAPPTLNLHNKDDQIQLNLVANKSQPFTIVNALTNSFGFGGVNASLIFGKLRE